MAPPDPRSFQAKGRRVGRVRRVRRRPKLPSNGVHALAGAAAGYFAGRLIAPKGAIPIIGAAAGFIAGAVYGALRTI